MVEGVDTNAVRKSAGAREKNPRKSADAHESTEGNAETLLRSASARADRPAGRLLAGGHESAAEDAIMMNACGGVKAAGTGEFGRWKRS